LKKSSKSSVESKKREVKKVSSSNKKVSKVNYAFQGDENDEKSSSKPKIKTEIRNNETLHIVAQVY
jgi:hypothetical protein